MPHHPFFIAVLASAVFAASQAPAQTEQGTAGSPARRGERVAQAGATAQTGGDAIVAPVKRVAPRTPVFTHGAAGGSGASGGKKQRMPVVPARPNCDPGFKVDQAGTACVPSSTGAAQAERNPEKASTKKRQR